MAASKVVARLSSRLQPLALRFKLNKTSSAPPKSPAFQSASTRPIPRIPRLPVELSSLLESMLPLHSAIAAARLKSSLSLESRCWGLVPQGISMPL